MADTLIVLGASGDMARRLLFPSLYQLEADKRLGDLRIVGYALEQWADEFSSHIKDGIGKLAGLKVEDAAWTRFAKRLSYRPGDLTGGALASLKPDVKGNVAFYLALPPGMFTTASSALAAAGFNDTKDGWRRLVIEKPFGTDTATAEKLNQELHSAWAEEQIFRIDHYLGKETVQNILVFRFGNRFLDPVLNSHHIESVQITAAETVGLEGRYRYYDGIGALRDMLQSHLLQLLAITAMEPPSLWDSEIIHDHKAEVLHSIRPIKPEDVSKLTVRGQYTAGKIAGTAVPAYKDEPQIDDDSRTETFAAIKLYIDNWRWSGVPFYLRSGKRMSSDVTEVAIRFRSPPTRLFHASDLEVPDNNRLVLRIRPSQSLALFVQARQPGLELESHEVALEANYASAGEHTSSAYQELILDVLAGDRMPFLRFDEVEWAWRVLQPVLDAWTEGKPEPYKAGTAGPTGMNRLLDPGDKWRDLTKDP